MQSCERGGQSFKVSGQPAKTGAPGKGAFDHPAPWEKDKALPGCFEFDHDQANSALGRLVCGVWPGVALVGKGQFYFLTRGLLEVFQQIGDLHALLRAGGGHFQSEQMAQVSTATCILEPFVR